MWSAIKRFFDKILTILVFGLGKKKGNDDGDNSE